MRKLSRVVTGLLLLTCFLTYSLSLTSCSSYAPNLWTGYDILNPSEEVKKNPLSFDADGNAVVNQAFILWVYELKEEVKKLREELRKK